MCALPMLRRIRKWLHVEKLADPGDEHVRLLEGLPARIVPEAAEVVEAEPASRIL